MAVVHAVRSDSTEETPGDNSETEIVAIQYATEIILSRSDWKHTETLLNYKEGFV